jgi:predicted transcriptional regulator
MPNSKFFGRTCSSVALISIHPRFVESIVAGTKNVEFRRRWSRTHVDALLIYATAPESSLVAVVKIDEVSHLGKGALWEKCKVLGGGLTRTELRQYFDGLPSGVALTLGARYAFARALPPASVLGRDFRPPQSFRYLTDSELVRLRRVIR